jgi:chromosome segregation ATPase
MLNALQTQWGRVRAARGDLRATRDGLEQLNGVVAQLAAALSEARTEIAALRATLSEFEGRFASDRSRLHAELAVLRTMVDDLKRGGSGRGTPRSDSVSTDR